MNNPFPRTAAVLSLLIVIAAGLPLHAQTNASDLSPGAVLASMQQVGDWQLAHAATNRPTGWIQAVGDVGMMALAGIAGDPKYRDAMVAKGETNGWQLDAYRGRKYHADDQCFGQVCAELYFLYRDNRMIAPMRDKFDWIIANPPKTQGLDHKLGEDQWSWCDALFMAPPAWLRLAAATGDTRYMDFAVTNFWRTTDFLYDTNAHLFFRDSTFFNKTETNGAKVFWSRGNGWVIAGIVRALQYLPMNHPDRPRFEQLFKDMAQTLLPLQQPDGLWRASLLDPPDFATPEASGSALFTYGLAWGVNQGLLDSATFEPAVRKAWPALVGCVNADGRLTHVQPAGDRPVSFSPDATSPYGGGVFLLAGSEVYRMMVLESAKSLVDHPSVPALPPGQKPIDMTVTWERVVKVKVSNPSDFRRECETVELNRYDQENGNLFGGVRFWPNAFAGSAAEAKIAVMDGVSSRILDSQSYEFENDVTNHQKVKLLFQVDLAPQETRTFFILDATVLPAVPPPIMKTMARFVPERFDDFAWESDRIAHRTYGLALIKAENTISSGPDVWIKKDRGLIVDTMYATKHYHEDNGSRGCGGVGIWDGQKLYTSSNYRVWKLITTGPIRSEFELTYDAWDAGNGRMVSETKRYSIDAGSWMTKAQSTFASDDKSPLTVGVGLAERACLSLIHI